MELKNRRISIIGAARSGLAAAKALLEHKARVFISDIQSEKCLLHRLQKAGIKGFVEYECSGHTEKTLDADFIVLSPGVRTDIPILLKAQEKNIPIYSEIEIAYRLSKGQRLAVTGSNGKTTTTTLLSKFCAEQYDKVFTGGNIGIPMMSFAFETTEQSVQVLEVSSFQLETIEHFKPDVAVITNFYQNHLDRYIDYDAYITAKKRIAMNMGPSDKLILNADQSDAMAELAETTRASVAWFGWNVPREGQSVTVENDMFVYYDNGSKTELFGVNEVKIIGQHNLLNVMCSTLAAILAGVSPKVMPGVVRNFSGVEHRLEWIRALNGITFINDSKGTNCAASIIALEACKQPVVLIAGGRDKGTDLSDWVDAVRKNAHSVVLYGEARSRFRSALEGYCKIKVATSFQTAVEQAYSIANKGDAVLLSPACSSYDMFEDFVARGKRFKEIVNSLES